MLVILKSPNGQQNIHVLMKIMMLEKIIQIHNMRNNYITYILWNIPWRHWSNHFDCFVLMWLAHHHEYALLAALCNIFNFYLRSQSYTFIPLRQTLDKKTQWVKPITMSIQCDKQIKKYHKIFFDQRRDLFLINLMINEIMVKRKRCWPKCPFDFKEYTWRGGYFATCIGVRCWVLWSAQKLERFC